MSERINYLMAVIAASMTAGCVASYVSPRGPADLSVFGGNREQLTDRDGQEILERKPLASLPTNLSISRVQQSDYQSYATDSWGFGNYSVVTTRDVETDEDYHRLGKLPQVNSIAMVGRLLLPRHLNSDLELRQAAAALQADMLLR